MEAPAAFLGIEAQWKILQRGKGGVWNLVLKPSDMG